MLGPAEGAGVRNDSGMITVLPQYGHFIVRVPVSGSNGPPQDGHLKARTDRFLVTVGSPLESDNAAKHTLICGG
jgi:hypothetical protein